MSRDDLKSYLVEIVDSLDSNELENLELFLVEKDKELNLSKELAVLNSEIKNSNRVIRKLKDEIDELKASNFMEFYKKVEITKELAENLPECGFFNKKEFLKAISELKEVLGELEDGYKKILKEFNITTLAKVGDKFDMNIHEAVDGSGNVIVEVYEQGFKLNDKILNYAKVKVGK